MPNLQSRLLCHMLACDQYNLMSFGILVFGWVQHEGTSCRQFLGANFKPFVVQLFHVAAREVLVLFCRSLLWREMFKASFTKVIYGKNSLRRIPIYVVLKRIAFF